MQDRQGGLLAVVTYTGWCWCDLHRKPCSGVFYTGLTPQGCDGTRDINIHICTDKNAILALTNVSNHNRRTRAFKGSQR